MLYMENISKVTLQNLKDFFDDHEYPWSMIPDIGRLLEDILYNGLEGYSLLKEGILVGKNVKISPDIVDPEETEKVIGETCNILETFFLKVFENKNSTQKGAVFV